MKRIKFNHAENSVVKAFGFENSDEITAATGDTNHPDSLKLKLAAVLLNADPNLVLAVWGHLLTGADLETTVTKNIETLFQNYDEKMLKVLDDKIALYQRNKTTLTKEDVEAMAYVNKALDSKDA